MRLFNHKIFWISMTILLTACGGGDSDSDGDGGSNVGDPAATPTPVTVVEPTPSPDAEAPASSDVVQKFSEGLHLSLVDNCAGCHGDGGSASPFAVSDAQAAWDQIVAKELVNLDAPGNSTLVFYMNSGHSCGANCEALETEFTDYIAALTDDGSASGPTEPTPQPEPTIEPSPDPVTPSPDPITPSPDPIVLNPQEKAFADTILPIVEPHCGGCHGVVNNSSNAGIDLPKFAHENPVIAHAVVTNRNLINSAIPINSRFVTRLAQDEHACWTNCDQDANTMLSAISEFVGVDITPVDPLPSPTPSPIAAPGPNGQASEDAFAQSVWILTRENCTGCHDGGIPTIARFADEDVAVAHDEVVNLGLADLDSPADSTLVEYLRDRLHNCWPSADNCESNANLMEQAIALWQELANIDGGEGGNNDPVALDDRYETVEGLEFTTEFVTQNDGDPDPGDTISVGGADRVSTEGGFVVNNGNATFTYTPPVGFSGEDSFEYTLVDDKGGSATATVYINVIENAGIVAVNDQIDVNQNGALVISNLLNNDIVAPGRTLQIVTVDNRSEFGASVSRDGNFVTYVPPADFSGTDTFAYSITDGFNFANGLVEVSVNAQPIAVSDAEYTYDGFELVTGNVLKNDIDVNGDSLFVSSIDTTGTSGDVQINGDGTFTYNPEPGVGQDSFEYIVSDGRGGSSSASVFINIIDPIFTDDNRFLQFINKTNPAVQESLDTAAAYYATVDPANRRTTLDDFREVNGFDVGADATAIYQNANDLGFIRRMFVRTDPLTGVVASYVENYPTFQAALDAVDGDRSGLLATVAMEYNVRAGADNDDPNEERFSVFFVYDAQGDRIGSIDLDGRGEKFVPGLCNTCHGGAPSSLVGGVYPNGGNTGAKYIAWDLDTFAFADDTASVAVDEDAFKIFNETVLNTNPPQIVADTIENWYGGPGLPSNAFLGGLAPDGWRPPLAPASAATLYSEVIFPYCHSCHDQKGSELQSDINFETYDKFMTYRDRVERAVFDEATMPMALLTFDRFWADEAAVEILAEAIDSQRFLEEEIIMTPGRVIANAGPSRRAPFGEVFLNGNASLFSGGEESFSWTLQTPPGSDAELEDADQAIATFDADVEGIYIAQLVVDDGNEDTPSSPPSEVVIQVSGVVQRSSFSRHVAPIFEESCAVCHNGFDDNPQFSTRGILYDAMIEYVNLDDPANSPIIAKPSGLNHDGGTIPGFESPTSEGYEAMIRWIAEGALDN